MPPESAIDPSLVLRLPLPLAQLYRRAYNTRSPRERHNTAYYLWEAALKLLGSVAIVEYAELGQHNPELDERLYNLARPALGHWWEFVRRLIPVLADSGDPGFIALRDLLLGRTRDDLPRTAGLYAVLREAVKGEGGSRSTVRLTELFDHLVKYRNDEIGHGAVGQRSGSFYEKVSEALLLGVEELLSRLDVLAGRQLIYIDDVRRQQNQNWLIERFELIGENMRRLESGEEKRAEALPHTACVYLGSPTSDSESTEKLVSLHPLLIYDADSAECFFLNARRGRKQAEYLCYATGRVVKRDDLVKDQRELLARVLGQSVNPNSVEQWASRSQAEEPETHEEPVTPTRTIGEFELISRIGRGGMGVVYRAWQPSLGRQVALKCLLRTGDPKSEARFAREIRSLGKVEHPNLVKAFTSGSEGDQWFYAMELMEGADLATVCAELAGRDASSVDAEAWQSAVSTAYQQQRNQEKSLSDDGTVATSSNVTSEPKTENVPATKQGHILHAVEVIRQIAEAAHALHESGVVHRDIKPGNIMLSPGGEHAVLMDLGLAQLADESDGRLTRTRQFVGTRRYASPEQVVAATKLDARSDVYSLGVTLWELLTLRPIFGADESMPTPEIMNKITLSEPERPRKHNPQIPMDLQAIVLKCLEKDRARRYATALDLAEDLRRWQAGEPVLAQAPTVGYLLQKLARKHRMGIAASVAGIALLVLATVGIAWQVERSRQETELSGLLNQLPLVNDASVPIVLERMNAYRERAVPRLLEGYSSSAEGSAARTALALGLFRFAPKMAPWELLRSGPNPDGRTRLIGRLSAGVFEPEVLMDRLDKEKDPTVRSALLLAFGEIPLDGMPADQRSQVLDRVFRAFELDEDGGVHSASEWLLRRWGQGDRLQEIIDRVRGQGESPNGRGWLVNSVGQTMILIKAGEFLMGSPPEEPGREENEGLVHRVLITKPYYLGSTEVTQGQWKAVMGTEPWKASYVKEGDNFPAVMVSWDDAVELYCKRLSKMEGKEYRLPTEAEWEYACRSGSRTKYSFGDSQDELGQYAWYFLNAFDANDSFARLVGQKMPSPWGVFDMHGSVWEWCSDWYDNYPSGPVEDPKGPEMGLRRVNRGGSWNAGPVDARSANRNWFSQSLCNDNLGFRVAFDR